MITFLVVPVFVKTLVFFLSKVVRFRFRESTVKSNKQTDSDTEGLYDDMDDQAHTAS